MYGAYKGESSTDFTTCLVQYFKRISLVKSKSRPANSAFESLFAHAYTPNA